MDLYILDSQIRRFEMVEQYKSLIWTERYSAKGDFVLEMDPVLAERELFVKGSFLACNKSELVMVIDNVEIANNDDGERVLKVTGPSLESVLEQRLNSYTKILLGQAAIPLTLGPLAPATMIRNMFSDVCVTNTAFSYGSPTVYPERIPFIQAGVYHSTVGMIAEPSVTPTIQTEVGELYTTIKNIADMYRLGFRLIRPAEDSKLYFEVYTGFDRTTGQTVNAPVVFSSEFDNLTDTSELTSISGLKNVAYVFAPNGSRAVYGENIDSTVQGFDKRVLMVDANDITLAAGASLNAALDQRGLEELAKNRIIIGFDGKIAQNSSLVYGVNYGLGDLVEQRDDKGTFNVMRVTEQIFISDAEGEKSYPTLTLDALIVAGSWDAVLATKYWDVYNTETWDSM